MHTLFVEPFGGMAGDMFLAALLDLGDPRFGLDDLREVAEALVPGESRIDCERVWRGSLSGTLLTVATPESGSAPHRRYADLAQLVRGAPLPEGCQDRALAVLRRIAEAEARVHDTTPEEIHFHEVGAVDTLIDVCGAAFALERLGVERVVATPPIAGSGTVHCAHGELPVPAPAVVELMRERPMVLGGGGGERLTPTGAAILCEWVADFAPPGAFTASRVGYGAGLRDPDEGPPNLVRVQLGESGARAARRTAWLLEVNLDDMTGEELGHTVRALRESGALEVWTSPVAMKKDRPGTVISALARASEREALEATVFELTTTLGVRWREVERTECERESMSVEVGDVAVRVKVRTRPEYAGRSPFGERDLAPEHDDVARAAEAAGLTLREARRQAVRAALAALAARP